MPTVEERLAALETKLAALTETTPTTYYEHQYSGEEIDNAVARALPNGAIDQAAGTFVRPNLLDNWYFGRPVDQRGGYLVYAGANLYSDASCTTIAGQVSGGPYAARAISNICVSFTSNATYYCKIGDTGVVRGYIPKWNGYSIDRWNVESDSDVVITLVNGGIRVKNTSNDRKQFKQILPNDLNLAGRMITISVLVGDIIGTVDYMLTQTNNPYQSSATCSILTNGLFSSNGYVIAGQQKIAFVFGPGAEITLLAAKLELGPTQTLAHREGDRWALNEVPDYGEQLRRCQRYARSLRGNSKSAYCQLATGVATSPTKATLYVPLAQPLRTGPVITSTGNFRIVARGGQVITVTGFDFNLSEWSGSIVRFGVSVAGGLTAGDFVVLQPNNEASADILLSADL